MQAHHEQLQEVYRAVIDEVLSKARADFVAEQSEPVIDELRVLWEQKLGESGVLNSPDEEAGPAQSTGSGPALNGLPLFDRGQPGQSRGRLPDLPFFGGQPAAPRQLPHLGQPAAHLSQGQDMQAYYRQQQLLLQQRHQRQQGAPPLMLSSTALPTQQGPLKQQPQQQLPHLVLPPLLMSQQHGLQPGAPLILSSMPAGGAQQGAVLGQHGSGAGLGQKRGMPDDFQGGQVYKQQRTEAAATRFQLGVPPQQHQPRQLPTLLPNLPQVDGPADDGPSASPAAKKGRKRKKEKAAQPAQEEAAPEAVTAREEGAAEEPEDNLSDVEIEDDDATGLPDVLLGQFELVKRVKTTWKVTMKAAILHAHGRDILISKVNGEMKF